MSSEMIVAFTAIIVSVMTLSVYIIQARIMMDQQHTSVWPHVEWTFTYVNDDSQEFYISVINKGVGPALVKDTNLYLDGKLYKYGEYRDFLKDLLGEARRDSLWIMYSIVDNRVMAPGDELKIFHVKSWRARIPAIEYDRIKYTLCYCSIYEDCWSTDGTISVAGSCN